MAEYICREETVKAFCEKCQGYYDGHCIHRGECDIDVIKTAPAADVQPVKHGRWRDCTFYDPYEKSYEQNFEYKCSCCGHMIYNKPNEDDQYCGRCGARMDLKDGDAE